MASQLDDNQKQKAKKHLVLLTVAIVGTLILLSVLSLITSH